MPRVSELTEATAATEDDLLVIVDAPGGAATAKKITVANANGAFPVNTVSAAGSTETLPAGSRETIHNVTLTADCTLTFPAAAAGRTFLLALTQDSTGDWTVTWPAAIVWVDGFAPTASAGKDVTDLYRFVCVDGSNWLGAVLGRRFSPNPPPQIVQTVAAGATSGTVGDATVVFPATPTDGNLLLVFTHGAGNRTATPPGGWTEQYETGNTDSTNLQCFSYTAGASESNSYFFDWDDTAEWNTAIAVEISGATGVDQVATSTTGTQPPSFTNVDHPDLVFLHVGQNSGSGLHLDVWETLYNKSQGFHQNLVGYQYAFGLTAAGVVLDPDSSNLPRGIVSVSST